MYFRSKYLGIKKIQKYIISNVLIITVLLPFVVQFIHSFEHHSHDVCTIVETHLHEHEVDCSVFHFKINQNSIDFSSEVILTENTSSETIIISSDAQIASIKLTHKSSRAPPSLLI